MNLRKELMKIPNWSLVFFSLLLSPYLLLRAETGDKCKEFASTVKLDNGEFIEEPDNYGTVCRILWLHREAPLHGLFLYHFKTTSEAEMLLTHAGKDFQYHESSAFGTYYSDNGTHWQSNRPYPLCSLYFPFSKTFVNVAWIPENTQVGDTARSCSLEKMPQKQKDQYLKLRELFSEGPLTPHPQIKDCLESREALRLPEAEILLKDQQFPSPKGITCTVSFLPSPEPLSVAKVFHFAQPEFASQFIKRTTTSLDKVSLGNGREAYILSGEASRSGGQRRFCSLVLQKNSTVVNLGWSFPIPEDENSAPSCDAAGIPEPQRKQLESLTDSR